MNSWSVQEAKAHFSELLNTCVTAGPQIVTRRGEETAVLISIEEWRQLQHAARPSLKSLLLSDCQTEELEIPQRGRSKRRNPPDL